MPIIFVHGVAVRDQTAFDGISTFLRRYIAPKLRPGSPQDVGIYAAFWGHDASTLAWRGMSRPRTALLGKGAQSASLSEQALMLTSFAADLRKLPDRSANPSGTARAMGASARSSSRISQGITVRNLDREQRSDLVAMTLAAPALKKVDLDHPIPIDLDLAVRIIEADDALGDSAESVEDIASRIPAPRGELLAKGAGWYGEIRDRLDEAVSRVGEAPGYVLTRALEELRVPLNDLVTRFLGDIFAYLTRRGGEVDKKSPPGRIPLDFLDVLVKAQFEHPNEKTVVLTHSMGGQIVYDAVTRFLPDYPQYRAAKPIDLWCASASQVGLFEEMKLFIKSDKAIGADKRVQHPRSYKRVIKWLNVWDRNDIISYTAAPIFDDVDDREYRGGASVLNAHGAYLVRPSFYKMMASEL